MPRLFATTRGIVLEHDGGFFAPARALSLDAVFEAADPVALVRDALADAAARWRSDNAGAVRRTLAVIHEELSRLKPGPVRVE